MIVDTTRFYVFYPRIEGKTIVTFSNGMTFIYIKELTRAGSANRQHADKETR